MARKFDELIGEFVDLADRVLRLPLPALQFVNSLEDNGGFVSCAVKGISLQNLFL